MWSFLHSNNPVETRVPCQAIHKIFSKKKLAQNWDFTLSAGSDIS